MADPRRFPAFRRGLALLAAKAFLRHLRRRLQHDAGFRPLMLLPGGDALGAGASCPLSGSGQDVRSAEPCRLAVLSDGSVRPTLFSPQFDLRTRIAHSRHFPGQKLRLGGDALGADPTYLLYLPSRSRGGLRRTDFGAWPRTAVSPRQIPPSLGAWQSHVGTGGGIVASGRSLAGEAGPGGGAAAVGGVRRLPAAAWRAARCFAVEV